MSVAELPIPIDREQIARFCRERGIRKLSLFGSVLRHDFDPQRSDVDVLAEFDPGVLKSVGFQYFGYGEELAAIIGQKVDFCSRLHPLILGRVKDELFPVYDSVDYDVIWGVVDVEAGKLKESVQAILAKEFPEAPPK